MIRRIIAIALLLAAANTGISAQGIVAGLDVFNFFDNSEGDDSYRNTVTHAALRFTPKLTVTTDDSIHSITGGYSGIFEYGKRELGKADVELYYRYRREGLRILFGSFPRRLMYEQMPEYLICDSINYYRPEMAGFDFLYTTDNGHLEAFCDWIQKRSPRDREQFMGGLTTRWRLPHSLQVGVEGYIYHYALEEGPLKEGHHIREVLMAHPYVGCLIGSDETDFRGDLRAGALIQGDRDRKDMQWRMAAGFIGDADLKYRRFMLHETFYAGKGQQPEGNRGFGKYYWGDTFLQSPWYSRTDVGYRIAKSKNVQFDTKAVFNFAEHGMQWHQMLTLRYNLDVKLK